MCVYVCVWLLYALTKRMRKRESHAETYIETLYSMKSRFAYVKITSLFSLRLAASTSIVYHLHIV